MALSIGLVGLALICIIAVLIWLRIQFLKEKKNERLHRLSTIVSLRYLLHILLKGVWYLYNNYSSIEKHQMSSEGKQLL